MLVSILLRLRLRPECFPLLQRRNGSKATSDNSCNRQTLGITQLGVLLAESLVGCDWPPWCAWSFLRCRLRWRCAWSKVWPALLHQISALNKSAAGQIWLSVGWEQQPNSALISLMNPGGLVLRSSDRKMNLSHYKNTVHARNRNTSDITSAAIESHSWGAHPSLWPSDLNTRQLSSLPKIALLNCQPCWATCVDKECKVLSAKILDQARGRPQCDRCQHCNTSISLAYLSFIFCVGSLHQARFELQCASWRFLFSTYLAIGVVYFVFALDAQPSTAFYACVEILTTIGVDPRWSQSLCFTSWNFVFVPLSGYGDLPFKDVNVFVTIYVLLGLGIIANIMSDIFTEVLLGRQESLEIVHIMVFARTNRDLCVKVALSHPKYQGWNLEKINSASPSTEHAICCKQIPTQTNQFQSEGV